MQASADDTLSTTPRSREQQREKTRARMLQATLEIIIEDGMRAVRHRAVAKRAGVSLGSTTYHFKTIEDLIISAFRYWREQALLVENPFYQQIQALLAPYNGKPVPEIDRVDIAARMLDISVGYLAHQLAGRREDRLLELAFHHESVRYPTLHQLVMEEWQAQVAFLVEVHRALGSTQPEVDAGITSALFRQLEQSTVLSMRPEPDMALIRATLHRHLGLSLGLKLPRQAR